MISTQRVVDALICLIIIRVSLVLNFSKCGQASRELSKASIALLALYTKLAKIWLLVLCHAYYADCNIETQESEYYEHGC